MAKRTSRPKNTAAIADEAGAMRNAPPTADDANTFRTAPAPADDSTRADSMSSEPPPVSPSRPIGDEDIRARAYQRYLDRGGAHGQDFEDWIAAERELRGRK